MTKFEDHDDDVSLYEIETFIESEGLVDGEGVSEDLEQALNDLFGEREISPEGFDLLYATFPIAMEEIEHEFDLDVVRFKNRESICAFASFRISCK